ncbi:MAG: hypothetical protein EHM23_22585 [Acidobacteria bacterium]|nr:MAG: hypothetical protein EHM23_22585 [Acidobacteriota bacterium]
MDQTVDPRLKDAMTEHLKECGTCSKLIQEVEHLRRQLNEIPQVSVPPGLVQRILERTSGAAPKRSLWADMVLPTIRPFLTQRYAFGTLIMLVFFALMVSMFGPTFSTMGYSDLSPSNVAENADRFTDQIRKKWAQVKTYQAKVAGEAKLMKEDVYGRIDYYLINLLFKSYSQSVQKEEQKKQQETKGQPATKPATAP